MTVEYLFELRFSEMPPRLLRRTTRQLSSRLFEDLMGRGLGPREVVTGRTPRRLMVCLQGLPEVEPDREVRELGPPIADAYDESGEPMEALTAFAQRVDVEVEDLRQVQTERGTYLAAFRQISGSPVGKVLAELLTVILRELPWWPPLRATGGPCSMLSLLDGEVLGLELPDVAPGWREWSLASGASTAGHPILSPEPFEVSDFADYLLRLRELGLEVIPEARRAALERALTDHADKLGGDLEGEAELLDRLTAACEIPGVVVGRFDADYTTMPEEVILAVLGGRLDAFALRGKDALLPFFLTVMDRADDPEGFVKAGQERAAAGRLVDARFRYEADRKLTLAERNRRLDGLDFHPRLGSYAAKVDRIRELVELACGELGWQDVAESASEAAGLLKADLTSGMVRDYPSLRGTIGGIYAREEGYVEVVWSAIYDHYGPFPRDRAGRVVAVADRLDSLVGFFDIDGMPSGSKDPFGLRRLARGLLGILVDGGMELDLDLMAARAVLLYGDVLDRGAEELLRDLQAFLAERFRHLLGQRGFAYDEIEAAEAVGTKSLPDLVARITALKTVREEPDFRSLVLAAKRIFNIIKDSQEFELRPEELAEGAEQDLHTALGPVREDVDLAAAERRYEDCLRQMATMVPHLDRFFADVLVMDEDESVRANRIALLQACRRVFWRIARLQAMAVEKGDPG